VTGKTGASAASVGPATTVNATASNRRFMKSLLIQISVHGI
jgi:hypothetical protein